jgi:DNA-binding transcriptional LysR family regulator
MNLRQLEIFLNVVEQGSFTLAAKELQMAQPAVSIAVRKLEDSLGLQLINRTDPISPTAEGEMLKAHAQQLLGQAALVEQAMFDLSSTKTGLIRFSTSAMLGSYFFPPLIEKFNKSYPNIDFQIINQGTVGAQEILDQQQADMAVVNMERKEDDIQAIPLTRQEVVVCVGKSNPLAKQKTITKEAFLSEPLVVYRKDYALRQLIDDMIDSMDKELRRQPNIILQTDLLGMILGSIAANHGVGLCLKIVAQKEEKLAFLSFETPIFLELGLGWKETQYLSKANQTFISFLQEECH